MAVITIWLKLSKRNRIVIHRLLKLNKAGAADNLLNATQNYRAVCLLWLGNLLYLIKHVWFYPAIYLVLYFREFCCSYNCITPYFHIDSCARFFLNITEQLNPLSNLQVSHEISVNTWNNNLFFKLKEENINI